MKTYAYYPGCSLETMAASYHISAVEVADALGARLAEIRDWNCCGATNYSHVDELLATVLCARNLALAEQDGNLDLVAPCSACFKNLSTANRHLQDDAALMDHMNFALEADDLTYRGTVRVHHLMSLFVEVIGLEAVRERSTDRLAGLNVAAYYGCQITRPRKPGQTMEDVEGPTFFEDLIEAIGATPVPFPHRLRCCGASLIVTNRRAALEMLRMVLESARDGGAEVIATACPLCQVNLEVYQSEVNRAFGTDFAIPVAYFTQLMGVAFGFEPEQMAIGKEFIPLPAALRS